MDKTVKTSETEGAFAYLSPERYLQYWFLISVHAIHGQLIQLLTIAYVNLREYKKFSSRYLCCPLFKHIVHVELKRHSKTFANTLYLLHILTFCTIFFTKSRINIFVRQ